MVYIIVGVILALIGFVLMSSSKKSARKSLTISSVDESSTRNIRENWESLSNSYGKGSFSLYIKLHGTAHAEKTLIADYSKKECVHYEVKVDQEYEELELKKDSQGKERKKWVRKQETVLDNHFTASDFAIKDAHGNVAINLRGAKIDTVETYSNFEKEEDQGRAGSHFNFTEMKISSSPTIRTIGYTYVERSIPLGQKLFVVGQANDSSGDLTISNPSEKNKPFIVSIKSESEITSDLSQSSKSKKGWGYGLLIAGVCFLAYGIIKQIGLI